MSYKTILVQLNDEERVASTLAPAVLLARQYNAHLIGLHVSPGLLYTPPLPGAGGVGWPESAGAASPRNSRPR